MTNPDSLAKVITEMRHSATWEDNVDAAIADELADRIERLDAEMRKDLHYLNQIIADLRAKLALSEEALAKAGVSPPTDPPACPDAASPHEH